MPFADGVAPRAAPERQHEKPQKTARLGLLQLLDPELYNVDPTAAIERLKGARNLRGRRRAAAARLAAWRETEAIRANRPRQVPVSV